MGWDHDARRKKLAPVGEYSPEPYRVVVHDTFQQYRLRMAAQVVRNGMSVPEFLLYCAERVVSRERRFKRLRSLFRKGKREILLAVAQVPEEEQGRCRRDALDRFSTGAWQALREDITGDRP